MPGLTFQIFGQDVSATRTLNNVAGQAEQTSNSAAGHFKKMGAALAGAFAGGAAIDFLKGSLDEATEAQKVGAQTTAVLKSTGNAAGVSATQIGNLANAISAKAGIDDEAIQSGENLLLTFTNVKNEAGAGNDIFNQTTKIMTDMSVATGTSMTSSATMLGKALNDPIAGVSKLTKVGVTFSAQQKEQIKSLTASGNSMGAQKIILAELSKEFGGSAAAQATDGEKMKVAFGNLQETIGGFLLPVLSKLASIFTNDIAPAMQSVFGFLSSHTTAVKVVAIAIGGLTTALIAAKIGLAAYNFVQGISAVLSGEQAAATGAQTLALGVQRVATMASAAAQWALNAAMDANPIMLVVLAIAAIVAALVLAWKHSETFRNIVHGAISAVGAVFSWLWNNVAKPVFDALKGAWNVVGTVVRTVGGAVSGVFRGIGAGLRWVWDNIISPIFGAIKSGITTVRNVVSKVGGAISNIFSGIGKGLQWVWDHTIGPIYNKIKEAVEWVANHIPGVTSGAAAAGNAFDAAKAKSLGLATVKPSTPGTGAHAQGTGFFGGGSTIVGELGPERVRLPRGSRIDTASMTASAMRGGSGSATVNIVLSPGVYDRAALGRQLAGDLEEHFGRGGILTTRPDSIQTR